MPASIIMRVIIIIIAMTLHMMCTICGRGGVKGLLGKREHTRESKLDLALAATFNSFLLVPVVFWTTPDQHSVLCANKKGMHRRRRRSIATGKSRFNDAT